MPTKRTKVEDKWWKMRDEFLQTEMIMETKAIKLADRAGLSAVAIGKTPLEWYYFIKGVGELRKAVPKVKRIIRRK